MTPQSSPHPGLVPVERCLERACVLPALKLGGRCRYCMALAGEDASWKVFLRPRAGAHYPAQDATEDNTLSAEQTAVLLDCGIGRVYAAVRLGVLPNAGEDGHVRIPLGELREFVENRPIRLKGGLPTWRDAVQVAGKGSG